MDWNFLCAHDDEKRLVLGAWTVMQKSVLRSLDNYHSVKTTKNTNLLKDLMNKVCYTEWVACCLRWHKPFFPTKVISFHHNLITYTLGILMLKPGASMLLPGYTPVNSSSRKPPDKF